MSKENQRAGIEAAKRRGLHLGRPPALTAAQIAEGKRLLDQGKATYPQLAKKFKVDRSTVYRKIRRSKKDKRR